MAKDIFAQMVKANEITSNDSLLRIRGSFIQAIRNANSGFLNIKIRDRRSKPAITYDITVRPGNVVCQQAVAAAIAAAVKTNKKPLTNTADIVAYVRPDNRRREDEQTPIKVWLNHSDRFAIALNGGKGKLIKAAAFVPKFEAPEMAPVEDKPLPEIDF